MIDDIFLIASAPGVFIIGAFIDDQVRARAEEIARRRGEEMKRARDLGFAEGQRAERLYLLKEREQLQMTRTAIEESRRQRFTVNEYLIAYRGRGMGR